MITTKIPSIYEVELPAEIKQILSALSVPVSFGFADVSVPLTCLGWGGYHAKLVFFLVAPPVVALAIILFSFARHGVRCRWNHPPVDAARPMDKATPWLLRLLFVAYPQVRPTQACCLPMHRRPSHKCTSFV